jgi:UDP-N-acetylmuramoyl-L-alanyl-D-glutamate--2,6-diaminopimelate ligase
MADTKDIILIAGKGHETYQEIKRERFDFDDYKTVQEFLKQLQK